MGSDAGAFPAFDRAPGLLERQKICTLTGAVTCTTCEKIDMQKLISRLRRDDEGAALVEYGLLVGLIAVICVVAVTALGTEVSAAFSSIASALSGL